MSDSSFPSLPTHWGPTRDILHGYAKVLGMIARAHAPVRPNWWHISLKPLPIGLAIDSLPLPDGSTCSVALDLTTHRAVVMHDGNAIGGVPLDAGLSPQALADTVIDKLTELGLPGVPDRSVLTGLESTGEYRPAAASTFLNALTAIAAVFEVHRSRLPGEPGPVQLWPHGFDLAFEWFGTRRVAGEDGHPAAAQLNLGWYPGAEAYFYSSPWPFDPALLDRPLAGGATWHTDGWHGAELGYASLADLPDGPERMLDFAAAVFEIAAPSLSG